MEMDVVQEAPGLSRRQRQATGEPGRWSKPGRSLKDVWHGLSTQSDVPQVDSVEAALAKEASFDREVGRVLLQWGQSSEGLQEMLLQVRTNTHSCCTIDTIGNRLAAILNAPQECLLHKYWDSHGNHVGSMNLVVTSCWSMPCLG